MDTYIEEIWVYQERDAGDEMDTRIEEKLGISREGC